MKNIQFLLNHLLALYKLPVRCFEGQKVVFQPELDIRNADPLVLDNNLRDSLANKWMGVPFVEIENRKIFYGVCCDNNGLICIIGPVAMENLNGSELYQYKQQHKLLGYIDFKIPKVNILKVAAILAIIHHKMNDEEIEMRCIMDNLELQYGDIKISDKDLFTYSFQNSEQDMEHLSYNQERSIMATFTEGDIESMKSFENTNLLEHVGVLANKSFKQMEYTAVAGITLFDRAAIEGGANSDEVHNIADLYLQKVALCKDELEIQKCLKNAAIDITECVNRAKLKYQGLKYIEQCKHFVIKHLNKKFTLEDVAKDIGINKCYLTHQFSRQEGKSLKRYIQEERIRAAQNMLKFSDQSMSVIASYLCFDSQSHFGSVFKKIVGITPSEYRKKNKSESFHAEKGAI